MKLPKARDTRARFVVALMIVVVVLSPVQETHALNANGMPHIIIHIPNQFCILALDFNFDYCFLHFHSEMHQDAKLHY